MIIKQGGAPALNNLTWLPLPPVAGVKCTFMSSTVARYSLMFVIVHYLYVFWFVYICVFTLHAHACNCMCVSL